MANPFKTGDIYQDSGEFTELEKQLIAVNKQLKVMIKETVASGEQLKSTYENASASTAKGQEAIIKYTKEAEKARAVYENTNKTLSKNEQLLKSVQIAKNQIVESEAAYLKLKKSGVATDKQLNEAQEGQVKAIQGLNSALSDNSIELAGIKNAKATLNQVYKNEAKLIASLDGSYNKLSAQYSLNKIKLNQMGEATKAERKSKRALEKETNNLYGSMKELQEATGKHTLSVGDYAKANDKLKGSLGGSISSVKTLGKSFRVLLANPVVLFLSLIVGSLSALGAAFGKSEKGAALMARATGIVSGVMGQLVEISVDLVDSLTAAFENPQQAIKDFGAFLYDQVINRLTGVLDIAVAVGKGLYSALTFDTQGIKDAAKDASTALVQITTGLDSQGQQDFADAIAETVAEVKKEAAALGELEVLKRNVIKANRKLTKSVEDLTTAEQLSNSIADDNTKSFKEREAAAEAAREALEKRASLEIQIAKNNLSVINQEIGIRRRNKENIEALLDTQLSSYQALKQAEREYTLAVRDNEKTRDELKQDRLERDLDILIDGFDNQKTINEKIIADETKTFNERQNLLNQTRQLSDDSFAAQIETIQQFTGIQINANELIEESDARVLNEKIRNLGLSEILEGRILESIRDRKSANQDLAESEQSLSVARNKALKDEALLIAKKEQANLDFFASQKQLQIEDFDEKQNLAQSEFDLLDKTAAEKEVFSLNAERERLKKIIQLNIDYGGKLSDAQIQIFKNQITKIDSEISAVGEGEKDLFDLLGFNLSDDEELALNASLDIAKNYLTALSDARLEAADAAIEAADKEVSAKQRALDAEIEAGKKGHANKVVTAKRELDLAKKQQADADKEKAKAVKEQQRLDTISQISALVTAAAKIWAANAATGSIKALPEIAIMFGSYAASKILASSLTKKKYAKGDYSIIGGGSHDSGNDTQIGPNEYAEQGEARIIIPKGNTSKYRSVLPRLARSLINGDFENKYQIKRTVSNNSNINLGGIASEIAGAIRDNERTSTYVNSDGNVVEIQGNRKITYVA